MTSWAEQGGAAFPVAERNGNGDFCGEYGMSMRDYYAGKAMAAMLTRSGTEGFSTIAVRAFVMADEMIKARERS